MSDLIKYYFQLQLRRFNRKCSELGVSPILHVVIVVVAFVVGSSYLFFRTPYAQYIYPALCIYVTFSLINRKHLTHLNTLFTTRTATWIRLSKNLMIALPFLLFLIYKGLWLWSLLLLVGQCFIAILPSTPSTPFKIPTPFQRRPFEFIVGFRNSFLLLILAYFLIFKAIQVGNANLGFAMIGFFFLLGIGYQMRIEDAHFVWIFNKTPHQLLIYKTRTAFRNVAIICLPATCILLPFFPSYWYIVLIIFLYGFILLALFILAKYAAYPKELNLPQVIILGISIIFPPLLLYTFPAFYKKAKEQLTPLLIC